MTMQSRLLLIGNTPSPYTRKMLALLRYRHIPHAVIWGDPKEVLQSKGVAPPKVSLLPTFLFADNEGGLQAQVDSTPIIRKLESLFDERSVLPSDPSLAFIDYLLEDFADEWCTKYMFHYRWHESKDADQAGTLLPFCIDPSMSIKQQQWAKQHFTKRQIERLYVVGSSTLTAPIIDASYRRFLCTLDEHLTHLPYLLGTRPSAADFALYGQLTQLAWFDPTPREITLALAPRVSAWTLKTEDLSGIEPSASDWLSLENAPSTLKSLLCEVGKVYVPALVANAKALAAGDTQWSLPIDGARWEQPSFAYQGKCLHWIKAEFEALSANDKTRVITLLEGTGCEPLCD